MKSFCTKKGNDIITTLVVYHSTVMIKSAGYDMIYRQGLPPPPLRQTNYYNRNEKKTWAKL